MNYSLVYLVLFNSFRRRWTVLKLIEEFEEFSKIFGSTLLLLYSILILSVTFHQVPTAKKYIHKFIHGVPSSNHHMKT